MGHALLKIWRKDEEDCGGEWRAWGVNYDTIIAIFIPPVSNLNVWAESTDIVVIQGGQEILAVTILKTLYDICKLSDSLKRPTKLMLMMLQFGFIALLYRDSPLASQNPM